MDDCRSQPVVVADLAADNADRGKTHTQSLQREKRPAASWPAAGRCNSVQGPAGKLPAWGPGMAHRGSTAFLDVMSLSNCGRKSTCLFFLFISGGSGWRGGSDQTLGTTWRDTRDANAQRQRRQETRITEEHTDRNRYGERGGPGSFRFPHGLFLFPVRSWKCSLSLSDVPSGAKLFSERAELAK